MTPVIGYFKIGAILEHSVSLKGLVGNALLLGLKLRSQLLENPGLVWVLFSWIKKWVYGVSKIIGCLATHEYSLTPDHGVLFDILTCYYEDFF